MALNIQLNYDSQILEFVRFDTGVIEYALVDSIQAVSCALIVSSAESDSDHDGRSDFLDYAYGGNPRGSDPNRSPSGGSVLESTVPYYSLSFDRRQSSSLVYQPPFPRPPVFAEATTGRPVRSNGSFRGLPQKANS